ncbi:hypothetical protein J6590_023674 [Homalodisca vitripennis]|nr:hypothetical protein J6590_023674 [Homalodisca vitripennis]
MSLLLPATTNLTLFSPTIEELNGNVLERPIPMELIAETDNPRDWRNIIASVTHAHYLLSTFVHHPISFFTHLTANTSSVTDHLQATTV